MNRLLPNFLAPLAAGAVGAAIVLLSVQPQAAAPQPVGGPSLAVAAGSDGSDELAARLTDLEMELVGIADRVEQLATVRASVPAAADGAVPSVPSPAIGAGTEPALLLQSVREAVAQIDTEKQEAAREEDLEERLEERERANEEYDELEADLSNRVASLGQQLQRDARAKRELESLLRLQDDRNREMTFQWSSGKVGEDELGEVFQANRKAHREEMLLLLGRDGLPGFKRFVREGGLGGRFSFFTVVRGGVHVNDLNATILHLLGIDHERFTFPHLGRDQRLTGVEEARVVHEVLA